MKYFSILIFILFTNACFSQNYRLTETDFGYSITDTLEQAIFTEYFSYVYECENAPDFLIGINDGYDRISLLNVKKKTFIDLAEYESALQISGKCMLTRNDYVRFYGNKLVGLLKFPDSIVLQPVYERIDAFTDAKSYLLTNKKQYLIYNCSNGKMSEPFELFPDYGGISFDDGYCYLEYSDHFYAKYENEIRFMDVNGNYYLVQNTPANSFHPEESDLIPVKQRNQYGYLDIHGNISIPFEYDDAGPFKFDGTLAFVKKNGKYGFIDNHNQILIPFIYDHADSYEDFYAKVSIGEIEFYIDELGDRKDGLFPQSNSSGKYGFVNKKKKTVIPFEFDEAGDFVAGMAPVKKNGKWGYISQTGTTLLEFKYEEARNFTMNLAACKLNGKWGYINYDGNFVIENTFDTAYSFDYESNEAKIGVLTETEMKYGIISVSGNHIIETVYDDIQPRSEYMYAVKADNKWGYLNPGGKLVIEYRFDEVKGFDRDLAGVVLNGKWGFIDKSGNEVIEFLFDEILAFRNELCAVKIAGKWGYIDKTGTMIIKPQFENADNFYGDKAEVTFNGKKGYINKQGQFVK